MGISTFNSQEGIRNAKLIAEHICKVNTSIKISKIKQLCSLEITSDVNQQDKDLSFKEHLIYIKNIFYTTMKVNNLKQYLPRPRAATSVATRIGDLPVLNSKRE